MAWRPCTEPSAVQGGQHPAAVVTGQDRLPGLEGFRMVIQLPQLEIVPMVVFTAGPCA